MHADLTYACMDTAGKGSPTAHACASPLAQQGQCMLPSRGILNQASNMMSGSAKELQKEYSMLPALREDLVQHMVEALATFCIQK